MQAKNVTSRKKQARGSSVNIDQYEAFKNKTIFQEKTEEEKNRF